MLKETQEKLAEAEKKNTEQKAFYEDALEKRFNQMEEYEEKSEMADKRAQQLTTELRDANEKVNVLLNRNTELKMQL